MDWFKTETPKEAARKAKRETRREVRVSVTVNAPADMADRRSRHVITPYYAHTLYFVRVLLLLSLIYLDLYLCRLYWDVLGGVLSALVYSFCVCGSVNDLFLRLRIPQKITDNNYSYN